MTRRHADTPKHLHCAYAQCYNLCMPLDADLIGSVEACEILSIHRATITRWVANGRITPVTQMPGDTGAFLFHRADVERLAAEADEAAS